MTGRMAGQTINDRLLAAKHSLAGQGLAKSVCKATTEEMIGPKKKHLDYLVHCTNEPNVSIPQLANLLIERSQNTNWIVVYKALITVHHVMCYGNERFTQYLASSNSTFQLSNFLDKSGVQGILNARTGYDMSPFIRRYSRYLNEKAMSYRTVAFDFCKVKRGKEDGMLRTMNADKLLKTLPVLQNQLDALLEFDCSANDLTNGVINMCFMLLFRDLIRLFACYNDGIINLLEKFFDMNKKQCKDALDIYKKFLIRMDKVGEFLKVAENVGIDKGDIPDLTKAPSSLLDALEQHLNHMEGKKSTQSTTTTASSNQKNVKSGVSVLSSTSNAFGNVASSSRFDTTNGIDENLKLQALAEEEAAMNQYKSKIVPTNNPFLSKSSSNVSPITTKTSQSAISEVDLFTTEPLQLSQQQNNKTSDDLLQLSNPFADAFTANAVPNAATTTITQPQMVTQPFVQTNNIWMPNGNGFPQTSPVSTISNGSFVSESNFASVFGTQETKSSSFDALGGVLQPMSAGQNNPTSATNGSISNNNNNNNNNKNNNNNNNNSNNNNQPTALLTGDLESSLASLAENLTINSRSVPVKGVQWNSPKNGSKTNWTPQPMSATTGAGYKPMNQSMSNNTPLTQTTLQPQIYPQLQPMMTMRPLVANPTMLPQLSPLGMVPNAPNQMGQQSLLFH